MDLPIVSEITDSLSAYQIAKRGNALRVVAEAVNWGKRGARINCISAGIIYTPLAYAELTSAERGGTPDEIGALAEFLFHAGYISGADILIDGGATAAYQYGVLKPPSEQHQ